MNPYYRDKWVTIYCGDCREILPQLDVKVDCIPTSPPFNKHSANRRTHPTDTWSGGGAAISYGGNKDDMPEGEYQNWQIEIINLCLGVLRDDGSIFYNHKNRTVNYGVIPPLKWLLETDAIIKQEIIWNRMMIVEVDKVRFYPKTERLYWLIKNKGQPYFNPESAKFTDIWDIPPSQNENKYRHPASFPEKLCSRCITATTQNGGLVLDPFLGSGTTCYCAKNLNRYSIGIEIEEKYCEIAARRCSQEVMELRC